MPVTAPIPSVFSDKPKTSLSRAQVRAGSDIWEPSEMTEPEVACAISPASEAALIAALDAPLAEDIGRDAAFTEKESLLKAIADHMTPVENLALARRLAASRSGDPIIIRLQRFVRDRRDRLYAYVADPKRRAARAARR